MLLKWQMLVKCCTSLHGMISAIKFWVFHSAWPMYFQSFSECLCHIQSQSQKKRTRNLYFTLYSKFQSGSFPPHNSHPSHSKIDLDRSVWEHSKKDLSHKEWSDKWVHSSPLIIPELEAAVPVIAGCFLGVEYSWTAPAAIQMARGIVWNCSTRERPPKWRYFFAPIFLQFSWACLNGPLASGLRPLQSQFEWLVWSGPL